MILVGNSRGGARDLALHLLKEENEHVEVHELRGFASDDLVSALGEAYAVSRGTRCQKFLFSLSLNPPQHERVETAAFEDAIERAEERLGLSGHPRAIVFHEKEGRRHCHAVWSRIDAEEMKAVPLPHSKLKLRDVARELYLEHGWTMPRGLMDSKLRDPRNFTLAEWQQARRAGRDAREVKEAIQECWAASDSRDAFEAALSEHGFRLARGDRRGFVVLDHEGEPYAVSRSADVKARDVRERLGDEKALPSIEEVRCQIAREMGEATQRLRKEAHERRQERRAAFERERGELAQRHRQERARTFAAIEARQERECRARQARFSSGLQGLWDRLRGEHARIRRLNEAEAYTAFQRDQRAKDALIFRQLEERQRLQGERVRQERELASSSRELGRDREDYRAMQDDPKVSARERFLERRRAQRDSAPGRQNRSDFDWEL